MGDADAACKTQTIWALDEVLLAAHGDRNQSGRVFMPTNAQLEDKLLNASEADIVGETRGPEIAGKSLEELRNLLTLLRKAHDKAKDIAARQQREMRGKAEPHGARPVQDNLGTKAKAQVLQEAILRVDAELQSRQT